jgi:mediator of RNA polymerase II transcription subunit 13, fungi type
VPQASILNNGLSDAETTLRQDGLLACVDAARKILWHFIISKKDGSGGPSEPLAEDALRLVHEGTFEPSAFSKPRLQALASSNTPNSSGSSASTPEVTQRSFQNLRAISWQRGLTASGDPDGKDAPLALAIATDYSSTSIHEAYHYFISALLASTMARLALELGAIPLSGDSILLQEQSPWSCHGGAQPTAAIANVRPFLTTAGSLVLALRVQPIKGLRSLGSADGLIGVMGDTVMLAPLGVFATVAESVSIQPEEVLQSDDSSITRMRQHFPESSQPERRRCLELFGSRGVPADIMQTRSWACMRALRLHPTRSVGDRRWASSFLRQLRFCWPAGLCFQKHARSKPIPLQIEEEDEQGSSYDPLTAAQAWFLDTEKREQEIAKRQEERDRLAVAQDRSDSESRPQPPVNSLSPIAIRRMSGSGAAAGAMYPTPPDGIQPSGVTPSIDGTMSSPGQQPSTAAVADIDTVMVGSGIGDEEVFDEVWDANDSQKRDRPPEPPIMFGDLGDDMFSGADITDADFNFFDEQPEAPDMDLAAVTDASPPDGDAEAGILHAPHADESAVSNTKPSETADTPTFTKPELRHARSVLEDEVKLRQAENEQAAKRHKQGAGSKRSSSPFDPAAIFKRVKASMESVPNQVVQTASSKINPGKRRSSIFEKVRFDAQLHIGRDYQENDDYEFSASSHKHPSNPGSIAHPTLPSYGAQSTSKKGKRLRDLPSNIGNLISDLESHSIRQQGQRSPAKIEMTPSKEALIDLEDVDSTEESSYHSDSDTTPAQSPLTLQKMTEVDTPSALVSSADLDSDPDPQTQSNTMQVLSQFDGLDVAEISPAEYFADLETVPFQRGISDKDFVQVAQIITEQAVSGHLDVTAVEVGQFMSEATTRRQEMAAIGRHCLSALHASLPRCLGSAMACSFRPYVDIQDLPLAGPQGRLQPRLPPGDLPRTASVFTITAPHLEARRTDTRLSVLPSAIGFWESLGLGPASGPKDVSACCVFPGWQGVENGAMALLDKLRVVYESLKLGSFEQLPPVHKKEWALVPIEMESTPSSQAASPTARIFGSQLNDQMSRLAHALSYSTLTDRNVVVYFVYLPQQPTSIVNACLAFQFLFEQFKRFLADRRKTCDTELVLQLVPIDLIANHETIAMTGPPAGFVRLCLETYDRCTLFGGSMPAPAITLELPPPRHIEFRFAADAANPLHENAHMHIAYATSLDGRWVSAAWTDNMGKRQMTASYCLGRRRDAPLATPFTEVAHEIWETTQDLISVWKVHWRIVIAKCGDAMEQWEAEFWSTLANTELKASMGLSLLTVSTKPSLQLLPPEVNLPPSTQNVFYTTPVSTPQPGTMSPEQSGNPATPMPATPKGATSAPAPAATPPSGTGATVGPTPAADTNPATDPEADSVLVDMTETTWGVITAHRLPNTSSLFEHDTALASGYLIKRGGAKPEDPPVVMEVNVIYLDASPPRAFMYEALLKETLGHYRNLGTLARARGIVHGVADVRPWHVAAAEKAVKVLGALL